MTQNPPVAIGFGRKTSLVARGKPHITKRPTWDWICYRIDMTWQFGAGPTPQDAYQDYLKRPGK